MKISSKRARATSLVLSVFLILSFFVAAPAKADELSDAKDTLTSVTTKLASLTTALTNATNEVTALNSKLIATDTSTADGPAIYASLESQLATANAVKTTIEGQIPAAQADVNTWTAKVATITAAINAANNCPADWGLVPANFSEGIDVGNFYFNNKVLNEINKDPRSIVVTTSFQISKDGTNWVDINTLSSQSWISYANNLKYSTSPQFTGVVRDSYTLLRYSNSQVRTTTKLDKQNCVSYSIQSDVKSLTTAAIPFSKTSIGELYTAYPQAFPNFQVRDQAIAVVETIKSELIRVSGSGTPFGFGKGYMGNFQIVTYPRSGACNGDINSANVGYNATCELGIYWLYGGVIKYVDSISVVGGLSEAAKQQAAMKPQLLALVVSAQKIHDSYVATQKEWNAFTSKYEEDLSAAGQDGITLILRLGSTFNDLGLSGQDVLNQMNTILNSQYVNSELQNIGGAPRAQLSKILPMLLRYPAIAKNYAAEISNAMNSTSADQQKETARAKSYEATANQDLKEASSIMQNVIDRWNKGIYKSISQEELSKETNQVVNYRATYENGLNTANQIISQLNSYVNNAKNASEQANWRSIQSIYSSVIKLYVNAIAFMDKATSYHKMVQPVGSVEAQNELNRANNLLAVASSENENLKNTASNYTAVLIAKKIGLNSDSYESEMKRLQILLDVNTRSMMDMNNGLNLAASYIKAAKDVQTWQQVSSVYVNAQNVTNTSVKIVKSMIAMLMKQKKFPTTNDEENSSDSSGPNFVDDNGEEESAAGTIVSKKDKQGRYLITVTSNQADTDITIKAIKSKSKAIVFSGTTDGDGNYYLRTTRKLVGYTLQLVLDSEILAKTARLK
jgi:hypothetical protein